MLAAHGGARLTFAKDRMSGDAGDGDGVGRNAQRFQVCAGFIRGDTIMVRGRGEPHAVHFEVGHHGDDASFEPALAAFALQQSCG
jgi:hypothetical protein